jgi:hypothetical protein
LVKPAHAVGGEKQNALVLL